MVKTNDWSFGFGICVLVTSFLIRGGGALKCYECSSDVDSSCANRYWLSGKLKECSFVHKACQIYIRKGSDGERVVSRACSFANLNICKAQIITRKTADIYSLDAGCCDTDACNSARNIQSNLMMFVIIATSLTAVTFS